MSTSVLKALTGKLDIKRHNQVFSIYLLFKLLYHPYLDPVLQETYFVLCIDLFLSLSLSVCLFYGIALFTLVLCHFQDDIITIEDLEKVMSSGLGRQYAFIGPIEALYLDSAGKSA